MPLDSMPLPYALVVCTTTSLFLCFLPIGEVAPKVDDDEKAKDGVGGVHREAGPIDEYDTDIDDEPPGTRP